VKANRLVPSALVLALMLGAPGCGGDDEEDSVGGGPSAGDALETCLTDEGLDIERGEPGPIRFDGETFTPESVLVESAGSFRRSDILVLDPQDAERYDRSLPPGVKDKSRFGPNVLVFTIDVAPPGPVRPPTVRANLRRALDACVG
jgi:hypothetical protein